MKANIIKIKAIIFSLVFAAVLCNYGPAMADTTTNCIITIKKAPAGGQSRAPNNSTQRIPQARPAPQRPLPSRTLSIVKQPRPPSTSRQSKDNPENAALSSLPPVTYPDLLSDERRPAPTRNPQALKVKNKPIVVVAFPDEASQEDTLGRIAFFTEREKGTIISREGLRRWYKLNNNKPFDAHDFKVQVLADFFNAFVRARKQESQLQLTSGEQWFLRELLRTGIIKYDTTGYSPGRTPFAVISYPAKHSLQSIPGVMKLFLEHEYNHAIFYTNKAYRQKVIQLWNNLPQAAQDDIIKIFLGKGYDISSSGVIHKEFAAYLRDFGRIARLGEPIGKLRQSSEWNAIERAIRQLRSYDTYYDNPIRTSDENSNNDWLRRFYELNPHMKPN